MTGDSGVPIVVNGTGRNLGADVAAGGAGVEQVRVEIHDHGVTIAGAASAPVVANFRDMTTIAVDRGRLLLVLGDGAARYLIEGLGDRLGLVVSELRERRARQTLHDRFIEVPYRERIELVEYATGDERGVAQIAYHDWGVALLPVDERSATRLIRRADVARVVADPGRGEVAMLIRARPSAPDPAKISLVGLGEQVERHRQLLDALRTGALQDAAMLVSRLMPDAPFGVRQAASAALVDGRPVSPSQLGEAWPYVERAVLIDPTFAASYRALATRANVDGLAAPSWLALAPTTTNQADDYKSWFFVGLPGNLVAFELVSEGAHATYLYRIVRRSAYSGETPAQLAAPLTQAVFDVSECLIDARFLREPIYLSETALLDPRYTRYRFVIAALPTLRAARWRFVGRLIHTDDASWTAALEDAIRFNSSTTDDAAVWPGSAILEGS